MTTVSLSPRHAYHFRWTKTPVYRPIQADANTYYNVAIRVKGVKQHQPMGWIGNVVQCTAAATTYMLNMALFRRPLLHDLRVIRAIYPIVACSTTAAMLVCPPWDRVAKTVHSWINAGNDDTGRGKLADTIATDIMRP